MPGRRLRTGFRLARRSLTVLRDHPRLAWFPVLAGVASVAYLAVLWASVLAVSAPSSTAALVVTGCFYLGSTFIASACTAGLMYCTRQALDGETPRLRDGFRAAGRNVGPLLAWSLVSAIVGVLLRVIEGDDSPLSMVVAALFSVAWSVLTLFVVPVVVFEDTGVVEMFTRSKETVVDTWGESLGAIGGVGLVTIALGLLGAVPGVVVLWVIPQSVGSLGVLVLVVGVLLAALVGQTLTGIAKTALYLYATDEDAAEYFDDIDFGGGDGPRGRLSGFQNSGGVV